jgi:hypothetical protein
MKRRKQIGKLIYTPRWGQGDVELREDYDGLNREEKLDVLSQWITELLSVRNEMIPNPKSWHHFMGEKEWVALTDDEVDDVGCDFATLGGDIEGKNWFAFYLAIEAKLREKNGG